MSEQFSLMSNLFAMSRFLFAQEPVRVMIAHTSAFFFLSSRLYERLSMNRCGTLGFLPSRIESIHWRELESAILDLYYIPWVFCWIFGFYLRRLLVPVIFGVDLRAWRRVQASRSSFTPCRMLAGGHSPKDLFTIEDPTTFFTFFLASRHPRAVLLFRRTFIFVPTAVLCYVSGDAQDIPWLSSAFGHHHLLLCSVC